MPLSTRPEHQSEGRSGWWGIDGRQEMVGYWWKGCKLSWNDEVLILPSLSTKIESKIIYRRKCPDGSITYLSA